jgi:hypothetical protein
MAKPILFNGEMVRAILSGQKDVTRRPMKWRPVSPADVSATRPPDLMAPGVAIDASQLAVWDDTGGRISLVWVHPPYTTDDRLYVRETWRTLVSLDGVPPRYIGRANQVHYEADGEPPDRSAWGLSPWSTRARPSIHMPHTLSRITLDVVDVRLERVADLGEDEARREGFASPEEFRAAWTALYGWDERAWWWRVEFRREEVSRGE